MNNLYFQRLFKQVMLPALIIFIHFLTYSQTLYNRTHKEDRASMLFSSIIQSDTAYKIIGVVSDYNPQLWGYGPMIIGEINNQGNVKQYKAFYDGFRKEYGVFENCLIQTTDGRYAVANSTRGGIGGYQTHPNRDGGRDSTHDYWVVKFCMEPFNAIEEINKEPGKVLVYPNPFSSDISIALKKEGISEAVFTVSNAMGQVIYHQKETNLAQGYTKNLDLSFLPNGIYFIEVSSPSNMQGGEPFREVKRVVKE